MGCRGPRILHLESRLSRKNMVCYFCCYLPADNVWLFVGSRLCCGSVVEGVALI